MTADIVTDALTMAWFRRKPGEGVIFHSDRGSQYAGHAIGRGLTAMPAGLARLPELELLAKVRLEGALALVGRRLAVQLGARHLGEGRPVATRGDGVERAFEGGAVLVKQGVGHESLRLGGLVGQTIQMDLFYVNTRYLIERSCAPRVSICRTVL